MASARRQGRRFDRVRDELIKQDAVDNLYLRIRDDKIVTKLLEQAKVTEGQAVDKTEGETADKKKSGGKAKAKAKPKAEEAPGDEAQAPGGEAEEQPAKLKRTPPKKSKKASDDAADAT